LNVESKFACRCPPWENEIPGDADLIILIRSRS